MTQQKRSTSGALAEVPIDRFGVAEFLEQFEFSVLAADHSVSFKYRWFERLVLSYARYLPIKVPGGNGEVKGTSVWCKGLAAADEMDDVASA